MRRIIAKVHTFPYSVRVGAAICCLVGSLFLVLQGWSVLIGYQLSSLQGTFETTSDVSPSYMGSFPHPTAVVHDSVRSTMQLALYLVEQGVGLLFEKSKDFLESIQ